MFQVGVVVLGTRIRGGGGGGGLPLAFSRTTLLGGGGGGGGEGQIRFACGRFSKSRLKRHN